MHRAQQRKEHLDSRVSSRSMESGLSSMENPDAAVQQRLHEVSRQREQFQQAEVEVTEDKKKRPQQRSVMSTLDDRWQRTRDHFHSYPYVWASYAFVFGGLGLYTAYRWRALRRAEDEILRFQERLKLTMTAKEIAEAIEEAKQIR